MNQKPKKRWTLTLLLSIFVFIVLLITVICSGGIVLLLVHSGVLHLTQNNHSGITIMVLTFAAASLCIGMLVTVLIGTAPLKIINHLIDGMNRLAEGHYETRLDLGNTPVAQEISESFNTLAHELENTEMLRSDFINNFSHEFKTPLVSVRGFAKLLKRANLSQEQTVEYLDIIEQESSRLADMATHVLDMTKIENQSILTNQSTFNLSEQIRNCVLLLEKKWVEKDLQMVLDFNEHMIYANEELLKHVWINLLDNAIKFSPPSQEVEVEIMEHPDEMEVIVKNSGPQIAEKDLKRIMQKFYQADTSHASEGNGIGLAIVQKIVDLHKGSITVESSEQATLFTVVLPRASFV